MTIDQASEALWGDDDIERSRTRLRNVLLRLRRAVGDLVVRTGSGLRLAPSVTCDLHDFRRRAQDALATARADPELAGELARGRPRRAETIRCSSSSSTTTGRSRRAAQIDQQRISLLDLLSVQAEDAGDLAAAQVLAERALVLDRYTDSRYVRLAELLTMQDRVAAAVAVLEDAAAVAREVGEGATGADTRREELLRRAHRLDGAGDRRFGGSGAGSDRGSWDRRRGRWSPAPRGPRGRPTGRARTASETMRCERVFTMSIMLGPRVHPASHAARGTPVHSADTAPDARCPACQCTQVPRTVQSTADARRVVRLASAQLPELPALIDGGGAAAVLRRRTAVPVGALGSRRRADGRPAGAGHGRPTTSRGGSPPTVVWADAEDAAAPRAPVVRRPGHGSVLVTGGPDRPERPPRLGGPPRPRAR